MTLLDRTTVADSIRELLEGAATLKVAIAFWGDKSAKMLEPMVGKPVQVICNLESGACNPAEIVKLMRMFPGSVRSHPGLHAKVWLTDEALILGSSNASANGLALEGVELEGWREANVRLGEGPTHASALHWFGALWNEVACKEVSAEMLADAAARWALRRPRRPLLTDALRTDGDLIQALRGSPEQFKDRNILVTQYRWGGSHVTTEELASKAGDLGIPIPSLDCYDGWHFDDGARTDSLPLSGTSVVDFNRSSADWGVFTVIPGTNPAMHQGVPRIWVSRSKVLQIGDDSYDIAPIHKELRDLITSVPGTNENFMTLYDFAVELHSKPEKVRETATWREDVLRGITELGGTGSLRQIYAKVRQIR
ncbi:MAG: hypothetical protein EON58_04930, partial [Alphaproteobacteria bacterium]